MKAKRDDYQFISQCYDDYLGDGICNDELNIKDCNFDDGDCCIKTIDSNYRCQQCHCWTEDDPNVTKDEKAYIQADGEMCLKLNQSSAYSCFPKAVVVFGGRSGR